MLRVSAIALIAVGTPAFSETVSNLEPGVLDLQSGTFSSTLILDGDRNAASSDTTVSSAAQQETVAAEDSSLSYKADVSTGEVGVAASTTDSLDPERASVQASIFDTLTFDFETGTSGLIEYSIAVDGSMSNVYDPSDGFQSGTDHITNVIITDVTDVEDPHHLSGYAGDETTYSVRANSEDIRVIPESEFFGEGTFAFSDPVSSETGAVLNSETSLDFCALNYPDAQYCEVIDEGTGQESMFDYVLTGSFVAEEGRVYAFELENIASVNGAGTLEVDALSTSVFSFTNTSGSTVFSASGALPGTEKMPEDSAVIPLPASAYLLIAGLGGLAMMRRRVRTEA